jgi:phosphoglycerate dehydrogenase-like enzyme
VPSRTIGLRVFRVGVTRDFRLPDGSLVFAPIDLSPLDASGLIDWEFLTDDVRELTPELLAGYDGLFHLSPAVTAASLAGVERLAIVSRSGVGLDNIDLDACTEHGVAVTVTPDAIRRPMASAAVALTLALAHRLLERHVAVKEGRWHDGRFGRMGLGLAGRTLGVIGFGNIGREVVRLMRPFEMRVLVATPRLQPDEAARHEVERVELDVLVAESDVVVVACPLKPETHHLLDARRLSLMKPTALLVNIARGPIIDQSALVNALREGRLGGAGLDVFEREPVPDDDPLTTFENVVAAPHALGFTDELFQGCVQQACRAIAEVAAGRPPPNVANPAVLESTAFQNKLDGFARPIKRRMNCHQDDAEGTTKD